MSNSELVDFIQSAIDLFNSVQEDIANDQGHSDETILCLSDFKAKHDGLADALDIMKGLGDGSH